VVRQLAADDSSYSATLGEWLLSPVIDFVDGNGQRADAIVLAQEAVDVFTRLNETDPVRYGPKLAEAKSGEPGVEQGRP